MTLQMPGQPGSIGMQPGMTSQGLAAGSAGMLAQFPGLQQANQALRPRGPQSYPSAAQGQTPAGAQGTPQAPTSGAAVSQAGVPMSSQGSLAQISAQQASLLGGAKPGQAAPQHMQGQAVILTDNLLFAGHKPCSLPECTSLQRFHITELSEGLR